MELLAEKNTDIQRVINYADSSVYLKEARCRMDERLKKLRGEKDDNPVYVADKSRDGYDA